jgi:PAS domain S-box-containing protein
MPLSAATIANLQHDLLVRIAEDATVGVAIIAAPDWRFIYANPAFRQLVGTDGTLAGHTIAQLFPSAEEDADDLFCAPLNTGQTLSRRAFPMRLHPGSSDTWWDLDLIPLPGADGTLTSLMIIGREVTDHVLARREAEQARAALHASEERLRLAIDAGRLFCWDWDPRTNVVIWSDGLEAAMRMPPGSFGGTIDAFHALVHPDDRDRIGQALRRALTGVAPYDVHFRMVRADGSIRWTATKANVLRGPAGEPVRVVGIDVDITEHKETEAALRESELMLRATLDSTPIGLGIIDRQIRFVHVNQHLARINGVPVTSHLGRTVREVIGSLADGLEPIYDHVMRTGTAVMNLPVSGALAHAPDSPRAWIASYHPIRNAAGELAALNAVVSEVNGPAAQAPAEAERLLRSVIESIPDSVTVQDLEGRYTVANHATGARLGVNPASVIGFTPAQVLPPDVAAQIDTQVSQVMQTGLPVEAEQTMRVNGIARTYHTVGSPLRDAAGGLCGVITVARDITERKRLEQLLTETNRELERQNAERMRAVAAATQHLQAEILRREEAQAALLQVQKLEALGQLTSGVAHDFNNVLAAISGSLELLRRHLAGDRQRQLADIGERAVQRAASLVRQLLSFARRQALEPQVIDLHSMLADTRNLLAHSLTGTITCTVDIAPDTSPIIADSNQLQVALLNLAVNARDAMPGGGTLTVSTRNLFVTDQDAPGFGNGPPPKPGHYVAIAVRDSGTGMPPEVLARVLEPFFTTKAPDKGTGLGLAMVHGFATQAGGALRIESRVNEGTVVEIILPRAEVGVSEPEDAVELESGMHGDADLLLVDDDPHVRMVAAGLLRELGYHVTEAANAEVAYAVAITMKRLDLVITDMAMPDGSGMTFVQRLRAERPSLPILFVTGLVDQPALDGESVLAKPFTRQELANAVLRKLRRINAHEKGSAMSDRLAARIHTEALRRVYQGWLRTKGLQVLPRLTEMDLTSFGLMDRMFVADVKGCEDVTTFRYLSVGRMLTIRLGRPLDGAEGHIANAQDMGDTALGSLNGAYLRCCRSKVPTYEFARYDLGDGVPALFERLLLPFSDDNQNVTHLVGLVLIPDAPTSTAC